MLPTRQEATHFPPSPSSGSLAGSEASWVWFCHPGKAAEPGTPQVTPVRFTICKRLDRWAWLVPQKCRTGYSRGPAEQHIFFLCILQIAASSEYEQVFFFPPLFRKSLCCCWWRRKIWVCFGCQHEGACLAWSCFSGMWNNVTQTQTVSASCSVTQDSFLKVKRGCGLALPEALH